MTNDLQRAIDTLDSIVQDPSRGLPEDVFLLISRMTPLVNVDLLIHDPARGYLLTWRDDAFFSPAWHIPGGIIRFRELAAQRICEVARMELGATVSFEPTPAMVYESIRPAPMSRGHFISLLYRCTLLTPPEPALQFVSGTPRARQWAWHATCPENLTDVQLPYAEFLVSASGEPN